MVNQRETAHRIFAAEFNASRVEIKGEGEQAPSYTLSPLGAKVNRVFIVGVLTEVEHVGDDGGIVRARVSDPTGVHTVFSGQFQPEATQSLSDVEPPQYVAVVGKSRVYEPEPGQFYVSIRPETVTVVDEEARNQWVLDAAQATSNRIDAYTKARTLESPNASSVEELQVEPWLAEGAALACEKYSGDVDVDFYQRAVRDALKFLQTGDMLPPPSSNGAGSAVAVPKPVEGPGEEIETAILEIIRGDAEATEKGAPWDTIVAGGQAKKIDEDTVEEAINALMDKGLVYEPILGRLKVT